MDNLGYDYFLAYSQYPDNISFVQHDMLQLKFLKNAYLCINFT